MLISELIKQLEAHKADLGDVRVDVVTQEGTFDDLSVFGLTTKTHDRYVTVVAIKHEGY